MQSWAMFGAQGPLHLVWTTGLITHQDSRASAAIRRCWSRFIPSGCVANWQPNRRMSATIANTGGRLYYCNCLHSMPVRHLRTMADKILIWLILKHSPYLDHYSKKRMPVPMINSLLSFLTLSLLSCLLQNAHWQHNEYWIYKQGPWSDKWYRYQHTR